MNILQKKVPLNDVPFFWSRMCQQSLVYSGYARKWSEVYIDGSLDELKFVAYYIDGDQVLAAASMNNLNAQQVINEALRQNVMPSATEIKSGKIHIPDIQALLKTKCKGNCKCKRAA